MYPPFASNATHLPVDAKKHRRRPKGRAVVVLSIVREMSGISGQASGSARPQSDKSAWLQL